MRTHAGPSRPTLTGCFLSIRPSSAPPLLTESFWYEHQEQSTPAGGGGGSSQRSLRLVVAGEEGAAAADRLSEACAASLQRAAGPAFLGCERAVCSRTWDYEVKFRFADDASREACLSEPAVAAELAASKAALAKLAEGGHAAVEDRSVSCEGH